jgi:CRISPR-associated endonuclease/helicase Cas3
MPVTSTFKQAVGKRNIEGIFLPLHIHCEDNQLTMQCILDILPLKLKNYLCTAFPSEKDMVNFILYAAYNHDIGKMARDWQSYIINATAKPIVYHTVYSYEMILNTYPAAESLAEILLAHHGVTDAGTKYTGNLFSKAKRNLQQWNDDWSIVLPEKAASLDLSEEVISINLPSQVRYLITGLVILADWLSSNEDYFPITRDKSGPIKPIDLPPSWTKYLTDFTSVFHFEPNDLQTKVMKICKAADTPKLLIIESETGSGKTEAALEAAAILAEKYSCGGVYFALPTKATANSLFNRFYPWAEKQAEYQGESLTINLKHSDAKHNADYQNVSGYLTSDSWFSGYKRNLLSSFVVGTIDGLLEAVTQEKHSMLYHVGIAGKVVIIDELHAYDAYMSAFLKDLLVWLGSYNVPVILASATLPIKLKKMYLEAYNLGLYNYLCMQEAKNEISLDTDIDSTSFLDDLDVDADYFSICEGCLLTTLSGKTVAPSTYKLPIQNYRKVQLDKETLPKGETLYSMVEDSVKQGLCVGIIVNTVAKAQTIYKELRKYIAEEDLTLLHARYNAKDRAVLEARVLQLAGKDSDTHRQGKVIIGTQVLEQALDLDFDILYTDLAPIDALLQRIGRLHRHSFRSRPQAAYTENGCAKCILLEPPKFSKSTKTSLTEYMVYGTLEMERTKEVLPSVLTIPNDVAKLVNQVYSATITSSDYTKMQKADSKLLPEPSYGLDSIQDFLPPYAAKHVGVRNIQHPQYLIVPVENFDLVQGYIQIQGRFYDSNHPLTVSEIAEIEASAIPITIYESSKWCLNSVEQGGLDLLPSIPQWNGFGKLPWQNYLKGVYLFPWKTEGLQIDSYLYTYTASLGLKTEKVHI